MAHFKQRHPLVMAEGGEGRIPAVGVAGYSWSIRWLGRNHYKIFLEDPNKFTITGATPDVIGLKLSMLFRLNRIEWSFDDTTSKDMDILHKAPHVNQLGYPDKIVSISADLNTEGRFVGGEAYEYEGGSIIEFQLTGTDGKFFSPIIYVQILDKEV